MLSEDRRADAAVLSEINITPFTDVLLVLLIIFMILASLAIPPGFEREFSNCACGSRTIAPPKQIHVTVTRRGDILVEGKAVAAAALYGVLVQLHAKTPRENVALYADAKAPYGAVIRVLDAAKAGGIPDVSFVTE
jgi:biopolymer transport protein ExbD